MAVLTRTSKLPKDVSDRLERGRERLRSLAPQRNECLEFWRGNQYAYVDDRGALQFLPTGVVTQKKAAWRKRTVRNLIRDIVAREVSAVTQRIPSYEVIPSTTDPDDVSAARLAQQVALYGYDRWKVRQAAVKAVTFAVVADEAFVWPYFDNRVGPFVRSPDGKTVVGQGEVCIRVFGPNEVYWEPGVRFEDSPWHVIEQARPIDQVRKMDGFTGHLKEDADTQSLASRGQDNPSGTRMTLVSEYLERPSPENPDGRWLTIADKREIVPARPYPSGSDDPVLRKLCYFTDPDSDRDQGLVRDLLEPQRSVNDVLSRLEEWKNLALNPQLFVAPGLLKKQRITDEPGKVYQIPDPERNVKWRDVPPVPGELFTLLDRTQADMGRIAAQNDIPSQVESGKGIQATIERDQARRAEFIANVAGWHSQVMHDCLSLVQRHYSEKRLLKVKGRFGWQSIPDFKGADLKSQVDVRVLPGSIEVRTRAQVEAKVLAFADRGWITPEQAMAAIDGGYAEDLARSYELDIQRAWRVIQKIVLGPDALFGAPRVSVDPATGKPQEVPVWMPRYIDNTQVHKTVFGDFMKTEDYERLEPGMQAAADEYYQQLLALEAQKQAEAAAAQARVAEQAGMENAARPQGAKPMPDRPSPDNNGLPTPNQPPEQSLPR